MDTYVKMLKIGNAPQNYSSSTTMKISASLEGLGPNFKLNLILDNVGNEPLYNCLLTLDYNRNIYIFDKENIQLILVNDGSEDKSDEICYKYKALYPNNVICIKQKNKEMK